MSSAFKINDWHGFAPGLHDRAAWLEWAQAPTPLLGDDVPGLPELPAMQRRRLERVGRMALHVAFQCQPRVAADIPLVFASRHGDLVRTLDMMQQHARGELLSPTQFGLSTHNAIAAQYTIARQSSANHIAVAAGAATAEAAFIEAIGLLHEGAPEVLVVLYDGRLPATYAGHRDEPDGDYAWACRVAGANAGETRYTVTAEPGVGMASSSALPHGLEVLRFLIGGERTMTWRTLSSCWRWCRHD